MPSPADHTKKAIEFSDQEHIGTVKVPEGYLDDFGRRVSQILFVRQENGSLHNSFEWGYSFYESVKNYDLSALDGLLQISQQDWRIGVLGPNDLRSSKNACLCLMSYVAQTALKERLVENERMYVILDACIQLLEECKNRREVILRTYASLYIMAEEIREYRQVNYHYLVRRAKEYVYKHFHERLTVEKIAKSLNVSVAYLARIFKETEQITLKQYIQKERIKRAKSLLRYSEDSIQAISQYLGFSSQSHFTELFKRTTGMTPLTYRNQFSEIYKQRM